MSANPFKDMEDTVAALRSENARLTADLESVRKERDEARVAAGTVLAMLGDGAISRGKCCEALAELAHGVPFDKIPLPKESGRQFSEDEIPAEVVGRMEEKLRVARADIEGIRRVAAIADCTDEETGDCIACKTIDGCNAALARIDAAPKGDKS